MAPHTRTLLICALALLHFSLPASGQQPRKRAPPAWMISATTPQQAASQTAQFPDSGQKTKALGGRTVQQIWWGEYKEYYDKKYATPDEEETAFNNFCRTLDEVKKVNLRPNPTWWASVNRLADMDDRTVLRMMSMQPGVVKAHLAHSRRMLAAAANSSTESVISTSSSTASAQSTQRRKLAGVPRKVDWKKAGKVTAAKWQGWCGGCWAYAAATAIESAYALSQDKSGSSVPILSAQQFLDCTNKGAGYYSSGCNGGMANEAFSYGSKKYMTLESEYPDKNAAPAGSCQKSRIEDASRRIKLDGDGGMVTPNSEEEMKKAVARQPVVAYFAVSGDFIRYSGGVFNGDCPNSVNHGLVVYGYDEDEGVWLAQNSWGEGWGDDGTVKLRMTGDSQGPCMLYSFAAYPSLDFSKTLGGRKTARRGFQ